MPGRHLAPPLGRDLGQRRKSSPHVLLALGVVGRQRGHGGGPVMAQPRATAWNSSVLMAGRSGRCRPRWPTRAGSSGTRLRPRRPWAAQRHTSAGTLTISSSRWRAAAGRPRGRAAAPRRCRPAHAGRRAGGGAPRQRPHRPARRWRLAGPRPARRSRGRRERGEQFDQDRCARRRQISGSARARRVG